MKMNIYAVKDRINGFGNLTLDYSDASACRNFATVINTVGNPYNEFPEDYDLYKLGIYNLEDGSIEKEKVPIFVESGKHVKKE